MSLTFSLPSTTLKYLEDHPEAFKDFLDKYGIYIDTVTGFVNAVKGAVSEFVEKYLKPAFNMLAEAFKQFIGWLYNNAIKPIMDFLSGAVNSAMKYFTDIFLVPIYNFYNTIVNRLKNKLEGVLFIMINTPITIRYAKRLADKPSLGGVLGIIPVTIMNYLISKMLYAMMFPQMPSPSYATPPSSRIEFPAPYQINYESVDVFAPSDNVSDWITPPSEVVDSFSGDDYVDTTLVMPTETSDTFQPSDSVETTP
jgi:hypothetical protein